MLFCEGGERFENSANVNRLVPVDLTHIRGDRIDIDERNVANFGEFLPKHLKARLQAKSYGLALDDGSLKSMDASEIGSSRFKARTQCIVCGIFGAQDYGAAKRCVSPVWPKTAVRNPRNDVNDSLRLAYSWFASKERELSARETVLPQPLNMFGLNLIQARQL